MLSSLNENQREIYQYVHTEKHSIAEAARHFNKPEGIIQAQLTRIRNKGVLLEQNIDRLKKTIANEGIAAANQPSSRPASSMPTSNDAVLRETERDPAVYDVDAAIETAQSQTNPNDDHLVDVKPIIMIGCAIQFMKFAGGRFAAHQLLEDAYEAIRLQVGDMPTQSTSEVEPWSGEGQSPLDMMKDVVEKMGKDPRFG